MSELTVLARAIAARVAARPVAALTLGYMAATFAASFVATYQREHARITTALDNRAEFVRSIRDRIERGEHDAPHEITDAEIARMATDD